MRKLLAIFHIHIHKKIAMVKNSVNKDIDVIAAELQKEAFKLSKK